MDQACRILPNPKNVQYLMDALDIIHRSCEGFLGGHYPDHRVIAGQLRMLLFDSNKGKENSLALKVFPSLSLHPMKKRITEEEIRKRLGEAKLVAPDVMGMQVWIPAAIAGVPEALRFVDVFDTEAAPIALDEWREQIGVVLGGKPFTLKEMIKSVAEKGGGSHVDDVPDAYLLNAGKMHHKGAGRRATGHHEPMMIAIGEYVVVELRRQLHALGRSTDAA